MIGFPKMQPRRRSKKHGVSILQKKDGVCYLCEKLHKSCRQHACLHKHHIFGGARRQISEAAGLFVYLCPEHHETGPEAVHREYAMMRMLQEDAQREYEKSHTRAEWMALIGKNYI